MNSDSSPSSFSGTDNLELMAEARRYNAYLINILLRWLPRTGTIVDFGAGSGTLAAALREKGIDVTCVEPDNELRARLDKLGFGTYSTADTLPANQANAVYSFNVLEHIVDDLSALRTLHGLLVPGGRIVLYVPAFELLFSSMDRHVGHVRRYRRRQLVERVTQAGFRVDQACYADSLGFFAALLYKLTGKRDGRINRRALIVYDRFVFPMSRALDRLVGRLFGKNLLVVAHKPPVTTP